MPISDIVKALPSDQAIDRSSYGDQYDQKINDLRNDIVAALNLTEAINGTSFADPNGVPTASANRGYVLGTGNEGLVAQLAVAAMAVRVVTGGTAVNNQGKSITIPTATSIAIAASDATNARKDIVVLTAAGAFKVYTGTPAGSPVDPTLSVGDVPLARVTVAANSTTVVTGNIADLRARAATDATVIPDGTLSASKLITFNSTVQTGTGALQDIAHGKATAPLLVSWSLSDTNGVALPHSFVEGLHTTTNIRMNVTSGVKYKVTALF